MATLTTCSQEESCRHRKRARESTANKTRKKAQVTVRRTRDVQEARKIATTAAPSPMTSPNEIARPRVARAIAPCALWVPTLAHLSLSLLLSFARLRLPLLAFPRGSTRYTSRPLGAGNKSVTQSSPQWRHLVRQVGNRQIAYSSTLLINLNCGYLYRNTR